MGFPNMSTDFLLEEKSDYNSENGNLCISMNRVYI